ncbi:MAG: hypothetical protein AB7E34_07130 [Acidaminococcaceae bacterium]
MTYADKLLNQAILMVLENTSQDELKKVCPIDGEALGWYFWLPGNAGPYELILQKWHRHADLERTTFLLKYYPDPSEKIFADFSCAEQIVRLSSCFEDQLLENEIGEMPSPLFEEAVDLRYLGIPRLQSRCFFEENLFLVGTITIFMNKDELIKSALETQTTYLQYSENGLLAEKESELIELTGNNELERKVKGLDICHPFYVFLTNTLFASIFLRTVKSEFYSTTGVISYRMEKEGYQNEYMNEIRQVELCNYYKEGIKV